MPTSLLCGPKLNPCAAPTYKPIVGTDKLGDHEFDLSRWFKAQLRSHLLDNVCDPSLFHRWLMSVY